MPKPKSNPWALYRSFVGSLIYWNWSLLSVIVMVLVGWVLFLLWTPFIPFVVVAHRISSQQEGDT